MIKTDDQKAPTIGEQIAAEFSADEMSLSEVKQRRLAGMIDAAMSGEAIKRIPRGDGYMIASFKHGYVGNDVLFWGPNGGGYTCMLDDAGIYTAEAALDIHDVPGEHYMVPVAWVQANLRCVVEIQRCGGAAEIRRIGNDAARAARAAIAAATK